MTKVVLWVDFHCEKMKSKAMKAVSKLPGVESVSVNMKDKKLTITGDVDPVSVVDKLKKVCNTEIISVGSEKEPEKKEESKKDDEKANKEAEEKEKLELEALSLAEHWRCCQICHRQMINPYSCPCCCTIVVEQDPNSCVIC